MKIYIHKFVYSRWYPCPCVPVFVSFVCRWCIRQEHKSPRSATETSYRYTLCVYLIHVRDETWRKALCVRLCSLLYGFLSITSDDFILFYFISYICSLLHATIESQCGCVCVCACVFRNTHVSIIKPNQHLDIMSIGKRLRFCCCCSFFIRSNFTALWLNIDETMCSTVFRYIFFCSCSALRFAYQSLLCVVSSHISYHVRENVSQFLNIIIIKREKKVATIRTSAHADTYVRIYTLYAKHIIIILCIRNEDEKKSNK